MTIEKSLAEPIRADHRVERLAAGAARATKFCIEAAPAPIPTLRAVMPLTEPTPQVVAQRRRVALAAADATAVLLAICAMTALLGGPGLSQSPARQLTEIAALATVWMVAIVANRLHLARCVERVGEEVRRILTAGAVAMATYLLAFYLSGQVLPARAWVVGTFGLVSMALIAERSVARQVFAGLRRGGRATRRVAILGTDLQASELYRTVNDDDRAGYDVVGMIGDPSSSSARDPEVPVLGGYDRAIDLLREHQCVGGIISTGSIEAGRVNALLRTLSDAQMHVALSTAMRDIDLKRMRPQDLDGEVLMYVESTVRTGWRMSAKRGFDFAFAVIALVAALPVLVVAAILIKLDSSGPVFFKQERVGRDGELFEMLKLRTMRVGAQREVDALRDLNEASGPMFKIKEDPRVTRIGRVLRRLSIDEIPQFVNVLRGDMSVVGPRPALPSEVEGWDPELRKRLEVPPGLSGLWQVSGRSDSSFEQYRRLDLYYVDNWSLAHDLEVIAKTFWVVLTARGAS